MPHPAPKALTVPVPINPRKPAAFDDADLDNLEEAARKRGINLELATYKGHLYINLIERKTRTPGSGLVVMHLLCDFVDARNLRIYLWANDNATRLVAYYKRLGFVQQYRGYPDGHLRRSPKRQPV